MTRQTAKKHAEVIVAFVNGKEIEVFNTSKQKWETIKEPFFFENDNYRIKKEKILSFDDAKNIISLGFVKSKETSDYISICQVTEQYVYLYNIGPVNYSLFQKSFTKIDDSPIEF